MIRAMFICKLTISLVVKEMPGKEIRLHVDKTTALDGSINVGEKVEAQATEKNHAVSIGHLQPKK